MSMMSQCCGLAILGIITYFYYYRKRISSKTGQNYIQLLFLTAFCSLIDLLSIVLINYEAYVGSFLVHAVAKLYVLGLVWITAFGIRYLMADIFRTPKEYKTAINVLMTILSVESVAVLVAPIKVFYDELGVAKYTYGPSATLTYVFVIVNIMALGVLMFLKRHIITKRRRMAVILWFLVWFGIAAIQFIFSEVLVVSFGACLGVAIIYFALENPEANIDRTTGFFNKSAFWEYASLKFKAGKPFSMVGVFCSDLGDDDPGVDSEKVTLKREVYDYLKLHETAQVFLNGLNEVFLTYEDARYARTQMNEMVERFKKGWGERENEMISASFIYVPDTKVIKDTEQFNNVLRFAMSGDRHSKDGVVVISPDVIEDMEKEAKVVAMIDSAIKENRVEVFYQPMINLASGRYTHAEALIRLKNDNEDIVSPHKFIDIAEKTGKVNALGNIIFEKVCNFVSSDRFEALEVDVIDVNVSTVQCCTIGLAEHFISIMEKYQVNPSNIVFEITETEAISAQEVFLENITKLREYGCQLSLDDFGTGHSNLNYIMKMPIDVVKFDMTLTREYFRNEKAKSIMTSVINLLNEMKLTIVVEGIENERMAKEMQRIGVHILQGYVFSKPLPFNEYVKFLENKKQV